jgi:hypothetical protein
LFGAPGTSVAAAGIEVAVAVAVAATAVKFVVIVTLHVTVPVPGAVELLHWSTVVGGMDTLRMPIGVVMVVVHVIAAPAPAVGLHWLTVLVAVPLATLAEQITAPPQPAVFVHSVIDEPDGAPCTPVTLLVIVTLHVRDAQLTAYPLHWLTVVTGCPCSGPGSCVTTQSPTSEHA